jgi:hypothetical protein
LKKEATDKGKICDKSAKFSILAADEKEAEIQKKGIILILKVIYFNV